MKSIKLMLSGVLLILFGPVMANLDVSFSGLAVVCWVIGIPLFIAGLIIPGDQRKTPVQQEDLPQKECPGCGKHHDFDYPKCPHCGHDYITNG